MEKRWYALLTGISYGIIFFAAIFANFFVLEAIKNAPIETVQSNGMFIRLGIIAFLIAAVFDVIIAWALFQFYEHHHLSRLSTYFRLIHAVIMGIAVFTLVVVFQFDSAGDILFQVGIFNTIWLIGLFFFGIHLLLLSRIIIRPKFIAIFIGIAGLMYCIDTIAQFGMPNYAQYQNFFLLLVAIPSVVGEMSFALWMIVKGGKEEMMIEA